jgi:hypothetical protein
VGPRTGLDDVGKRKISPLPLLKLVHFSRPARSQSLYLLSYPGSWYNVITFMKMNLVKVRLFQCVLAVNEDMYATGETVLPCCIYIVFRV